MTERSLQLHPAPYIPYVHYSNQVDEERSHSLLFRSITKFLIFLVRNLYSKVAREIDENSPILGRVTSFVKKWLKMIPTDFNDDEMYHQILEFMTKDIAAHFPEQAKAFESNIESAVPRISYQPHFHLMASGSWTGISRNMNQHLLFLWFFLSLHYLTCFCILTNR